MYACIVPPLCVLLLAIHYWNSTWNTLLKFNVEMQCWNTIWNVMWNGMWNGMWNTMWHTMWSIMWNTMLKCNVEILVGNTDNILILNLLWHNISHLRNSIRTIHHQITPWNTLSKPLRKYYLLWNKQRIATENSDCTFATWLSTWFKHLKLPREFVHVNATYFLYIIAKQDRQTEGG